MKRKPLLLPLLLLVLFLFGASAQAAEPGTTLNVDMTETKSGQFYYDGRAHGYGSTIYHKFTLKKPALVRMYGNTYSSEGEKQYERMYGSFTLCDKNQKEILTISDYYNHGDGKISAYFFLKAGTYQLKVEPSYPYDLRLKYKNYSRKSGSSKKKAVGLKKGKNTTGYFLAKEKGDHWYKFKLTKKQKVPMKFESYGTGRVYFYIYGTGKSNVTSVSMYDGSDEGTYETIGGKNLPKGTYYIKVSRLSKADSAQYGIKAKFK